MGISRWLVIVVGLRRGIHVQHVQLLLFLRGSFVVAGQTCSGFRQDFLLSLLDQRFERFTVLRFFLFGNVDFLSSLVRRSVIIVLVVVSVDISVIG